MLCLCSGNGLFDKHNASMLKNKQCGVKMVDKTGMIASISDITKN